MYTVLSHFGTKHFYLFNAPPTGTAPIPGATTQTTRTTSATTNRAASALCRTTSWTHTTLSAAAREGGKMCYDGEDQEERRGKMCVDRVKRRRRKRQSNVCVRVEWIKKRDVCG